MKDADKKLEEGARFALEKVGSDEVPMGRSKEVREQIRELCRVVEEAYFHLGQLLYEVYHREYWQEWGYEAFEDYVWEELRFRKRKAQYLLSIWKRLRVDAGLSEKEIEGLPWSTAKEVVRMIPEGADRQEVLELVEKAKDMTVIEVAEMARKAGAGVNGVVEKLSRLTFALYEGQRENVEKALETAGRLTGSEKKGNLLDVICLEWNTAHLSGGGKGESLEWFLTRLEEVFGVKLIAVTDEVAGKLADLIE